MQGFSETIYNDRKPAAAVAGCMSSISSYILDRLPLFSLSSPHFMSNFTRAFAQCKIDVGKIKTEGTSPWFNESPTKH